MHEIAYFRYRNIVGQSAKNRETFDNIKFPDSTMDSNMIAVNRTFIAFIETTLGGGSFLLLPIEKGGKVTHNSPRVLGHKAQVLDIAFSPFDDNIIASASADCLIRLWDIPKDGLKNNLTVPLIELEGHDRKVCIIQWNPIAENILISGGVDPYCIMWDVEKAQAISKIDLDSGICSFSFSYDGFKVAAMLRNMKLAVFDPKSKKTEYGSITHNFVRSGRCVFLKNNNIFTCGFEVGAERCLRIWDSKNLSTCLGQLTLDSNHGLMLVHYEPEHSLMFIIGRGDSCISVVQIYPKAPYLEYLSKYQSTLTSQRCFAASPSIACDPNNCEVSRLYRGLGNGFCEVLSFVLPSMSSATVKDMFSPVRADSPTLTAEEYVSCKSPVKPKTISYFTEKDDKAAANRQNRILQRKQSRFPRKGIDNFEDMAERLEKVEDRLKQIENNDLSGNIYKFVCFLVVFVTCFISWFIHDDN